MKVLVAIDSFKGSLSSWQAGQAVRDGVLKAIPEAKIHISPLADGGEGTVEALTQAMSGQIKKIEVTGPLSKKVWAEYGISSETAIIEMAAAAGITLISDKERNPLLTTTFGVGEIIKDAIAKGCRRFIVGIGGSATNDAGLGMLQALGCKFLDKDGCQVPFGAQALELIEYIDDSQMIPELKDCCFRIACDVTNPLCGEKGCSAVYGPQKGATPQMVERMDKAIRRYATLVKSIRPSADPDMPGTGAAGGLGFAFLSFTNASLEPGTQIVLQETTLEQHIKQADVVVTGEGKLDSQTVMGKAPIGVARLAKAHSKRVIAFSGCVSSDASVCNEHGIDAFFPIVRRACSLEEAMLQDNAYNNLRDTAEQVFRLIHS